MHEQTLPDTIAGIAIPRTGLSREAESFVRTAVAPFLFHHSVRSFVFAACDFERRGIAYDAEIAFVAALFHDLGLADAHASEEHRFELDGADAARTFLLEHDVTPERAQRCWMAIALHACGEIPLRLEPEIALLALGTSMDVAGFGLRGVAAERRAAILEAAPRANFKREILAAFLAYARRKPLAQCFTITDAYVRAHTPGLELPTLDDIVLSAAFDE